MKSSFSRIDQARKSKETDKETALQEECHTITMDVQAVKLAPHLPASNLYYKAKLCCHNFTIATKEVTCYWYNESNADGLASTYASFLVEYLAQLILSSPTKLPIIIYSDGFTAQNRNAFLANALILVLSRLICNKPYQSHPKFDSWACILFKGL